MRRAPASALASLGACACVLVVLMAGLIASPAGLLLLVLFLSFASVPALAGAALEGFAAHALLRGRRPVAMLIVSAVLLAPGAAVCAWIGLAVLDKPDDLAPGTRAAAEIALVAGPLGWGLSVMGAVLVLLGPAPTRSATRVIAWTNAAVLVLSLSVLAGWSVPGGS